MVKPEPSQLGKSRIVPPRRSRASRSDWDAVFTAPINRTSVGRLFRCSHVGDSWRLRDALGARHGRVERSDNLENALRREILVSATAQESWVALIEDKQLVQIMFDRPDQNRVIGDIFLGRVDAVLPGIQAAFVDIGTEKAGFLHVSDLNFGDEEDDDDENGNGNGGGRGRGRSRPTKYPPIQEHVKKGQEILVQVTKEPISTKGPRLTAQISLPGRFLVYMPFSSHVGVSRKIEGRDQRAKLRKMAKQVMPPDSGGMIVRTVGEEVTQERLDKEFRRLNARWEVIQDGDRTKKAPALVHREAKLISGVIRDLFSDKFDA
ncbi:MAG: hypothetical protein E4G90_09555, partial [Gemmatimonadales bacterium]